MKNNYEVKLYMAERRKGLSQKVAAARAGMSERTARKYEQAGMLPSQLKRPHDWQTRSNPFEEDWPWVVAQLERDPALQATTLFALLCEKHPGRYRPTQDRTLRRHIARWRALHGPEQEVIFEQRHTPGERAQSDFTHMEELDVTIAGEPFPHLFYHFVLTYHLSAAVRQLRKEEQEEWTARYQALMTHYGMQPTWNNTGVAHENGDVEQAHHRFKEAVDQALRVRGSRDFATRGAYEHFVADLIHKRNQTRTARFSAEKVVLRPLPATALAPCKELRVTVSRFSTITLAGNVYSVPSRLIGTSVLLRIRAEHLEGYVGTTRVFDLPRLIGKHHHRIDYHHIIWSLVRKPGAFAAYRYRDELFPTTTFRLAYDRLRSQGAKRADRDYVRLLHLAASTRGGQKSKRRYRSSWKRGTLQRL
jgi:hypothetical protein